MVAVVCGWFAALARADGDPASDVLVTQPLFLPQDAGAPPTQQNQLGALLAAAHRSGYQIRVALIASSADLGSVTELWSKPQTYAEFLGQELSLVYRGPLLVIMPAGFGFSGFVRPPAAERSALAGVRPSAARGGLGAAAITAVRRLAALSGHNLAVPVPAVGTSARNPTDTAAWIVFAAGAALIILAWRASLRARPLRVGRESARGS